MSFSLSFLAGLLGINNIYSLCIFLVPLSLTLFPWFCRPFGVSLHDINLLTAPFVHLPLGCFRSPFLCMRTVCIFVSYTRSLRCHPQYFFQLYYVSVDSVYGIFYQLKFKIFVVRHVHLLIACFCAIYIFIILSYLIQEHSIYFHQLKFSIT